MDYFTEAYCRVQDADTELLVKGMKDASERGAMMALTCETATECVSERGKEVCAEINGECVTEQDGYYYISGICMIFGVLFLIAYIIPTARRLQGELEQSWRRITRMLTGPTSQYCQCIGGGLVQTKGVESLP